MIFVSILGAGVGVSVGVVIPVVKGVSIRPDVGGAVDGLDTVGVDVGEIEFGVFGVSWGETACSRSLLESDWMLDDGPVCSIAGSID